MHVIFLARMSVCAIRLFALHSSCGIYAPFGIHAHLELALVR
ncbi:hypothetical protein HMPREF0091_10502 [Fannyhessea vaginae DSM 15829]|uniref:Uncharacterized protein n=1 Tax=Fannyhessea vaginae DSM 15829 TaxID=525256 RepID=F1T4B1_9ACTN|nr:hypothetical protein HMPREF0091_10502 [Fannyhessea vaginae DSM 15829]